MRMRIRKLLIRVVEGKCGICKRFVAVCYDCQKGLVRLITVPLGEVCSKDTRGNI
jgi:hypothetical protein